MAGFARALHYVVRRGAQWNCSSPYVPVAMGTPPRRRALPAPSVPIRVTVGSQVEQNFALQRLGDRCLVRARLADRCCSARAATVSARLGDSLTGGLSDSSKGTAGYRLTLPVDPPPAGFSYLSPRPARLPPKDELGIDDSGGEHRSRKRQGGNESLVQDEPPPLPDRSRQRHRRAEVPAKRRGTEARLRPLTVN